MVQFICSIILTILEQINDFLFLLDLLPIIIIHSSRMAIFSWILYSWTLHEDYFLFHHIASTRMIPFSRLSEFIIVHLFAVGLALSKRTISKFIDVSTVHLSVVFFLRSSELSSNLKKDSNLVTRMWLAWIVHLDKVVVLGKEKYTGRELMSPNWLLLSLQFHLENGSSS